MTPLHELLQQVVGPERSDELLATVAVPPALVGEEQPRGQVRRAAVAMVLSLVLLDDLLRRVPTGERYLALQRARGRRVVYDHGAVRTVDWTETGELPAGVELFRRLLVPLGYQEVGVYPLDRIHMTGKVFAHAELPEELPQYFVSELHVERLPSEAQEAVTRVVGTSDDPLDDDARGLLDLVASGGWMALDDARRLVPTVAACFGRHHADPSLTDYETLQDHSAEMAWIATEGNAFNHATDRVPDVDGLAAELASEWPLKDTVERSGSGRVRQTAFRADPVSRRFVDPDGQLVERQVPGSFFELISRDHLPDGPLDLTFDAGNAQGIFHMTRPHS
jgi:uncharacterized glyoxalase superfamily metalloenzyme YdcJ